MRVLVAGATGVLGRRLVPLLASAGHQVTAMSRPGGRVGEAPQAGARVALADALNREEVMRAVGQSEPEAVVHLLTAIPSTINPRHMARDFAVTNRLRTEGTRHLLAAARRVGARRVITQSVAFGYEPGEGLANEDTDLWHRPPKQFSVPLEALRELERRTSEEGGLTLRFGHVYGPGSAFARGGSMTGQILTGKLPIVGDGGSTFSFVHAEDAATAIVAALDKDIAGALNVVDDEPALVRDWLPGTARLLGAPAPKHVPAALARLAVGSWGVAFMTQLRGADNSRAKLTLGWRPRYASWQQGFAKEFGS